MQVMKDLIVELQDILSRVRIPEAHIHAWSILLFIVLYNVCFVRHIWGWCSPGWVSLHGKCNKIKKF